MLNHKIYWTMNLVVGLLLLVVVFYFALEPSISVSHVSCFNRSMSFFPGSLNNFSVENDESFVVGYDESGSFFHVAKNGTLLLDAGHCSSKGIFISTRFKINSLDGVADVWNNELVGGWGLFIKYNRNGDLLELSAKKINETDFLLGVFYKVNNITGTWKLSNETLKINHTYKIMTLWKADGVLSVFSNETIFININTGRPMQSGNLMPLRWCGGVSGDYQNIQGFDINCYELIVEEGV